MGYSYPPKKNHGKTIERFATLQVKSPFHTTVLVVQVLELILWQSQRHQDLLQRLVLGTGNLRAFDVEVILPRCGSQSWHVTDHIGVGEIELLQLREILQRLNVTRDLGQSEAEPLQLREILQRLNVTRDLGPVEVEDLQVWQCAEVRTQGAGELTTVPPQIDLHHFAALPRLRDPRRGRRSHGSRLSWQIFYRKFCCVWKIIPFYFSILGNHGKNYRKSCHSAEKSPQHTPHVVQVREFWFWQSQRHQDLLQRRLLATGLSSLHRFASDIHSFAEAAVQLRLQSPRFS